MVRGSGSVRSTMGTIFPKGPYIHIYFVFFTSSLRLEDGHYHRFNNLHDQRHPGDHQLPHLIAIQATNHPFTSNQSSNQSLTSIQFSNHYIPFSHFTHSSQVQSHPHLPTQLQVSNHSSTSLPNINSGKNNGTYIDQISSCLDGAFW